MVDLSSPAAPPSGSTSKGVIDSNSPTSVRAREGREIQLEEVLYDSPDRTRNPNRRFEPEGDEEDQGGDLGGPRLFPTVSFSSTDKGKGRLRDLDQEEEAEQVVDEEAEERKIKANLAKWSKADAKRRASMRRSSQFVVPTLPNQIPPVPSASTLIRRTSTMIRKKTTRRRTIGAQEEDRDGVMELSSSAGSGANRTRKGRRKDSVVLEQGRDGFVSPDSVLELPLVPGEEEEETPPVSPRPRDVDHSTRQSHESSASGSRFIEDLPLASPRSSTSHHQNPFSPPITPVKNPFSDSSRIPPRSSLDPESTPKAALSSSHPDPRSTSTTSFESHSSADTATISGGGGGGGRTTRPDQPLAEQYESHSRTTSRSQAYYYQDQAEGEDEEARRPYFHEPLEPPPLVVPPSTSKLVTKTRNTLSAEEEEENVEVRNTVGLLDWLLCGCFRPRGWDDDSAEGMDGRKHWEQQGRTNPME